MTAPLASLISAVVGVRGDTAREALASAIWRELSIGSAVAALEKVAQELSSNNLIPTREQADRFRLLLRQVGSERLDPDALLKIGGQMAPHLKLELAPALPLVLRPALYGRSRLAQTTLPTTDEGRAIERVVTRQSEIVRDGASLPSDCNTVVLLGHQDRQEANVRLLSRHGFDPRVVETVDDLDPLLLQESGICACVIDRSVLTGLDRDAQRRLFRRLGEYSTFIHIRVETRYQDDGLRLDVPTVRQLVKGARALLEPLPEVALAFQTDGNIAPMELSDFEAASRMLGSHESTRFVVDELTVAESHLLVAAARSRLTAHSGRPDIEVRTLATRVLTGGKSGARLATMRVNEGVGTLVAKVTTKEAALDEIRRFQQYIRQWDEDVSAQLHFHRDTAVILTGLVSQDVDRTEPAISLDEHIAELWNQEWFGYEQESQGERVMLLRRALARAAQRLEKLNTTKASSGDGQLMELVDGIAKLKEAGFDPGLGPDAVRARERARSRFARLGTSALVHGDVHLRNMLIRGDTDVHFIDFAASGPGHPAIDLVRLELHLYTGPVRQFATVEECVDFQKGLSVDQMALEVLKQRYPTFFRCAVNEACACGMVAARDSALAAIRSFGGDTDDYLATKFLVAWQLLGMIGQQGGLARAVIQALTSAVVAIQVE